MLETIRLNCKVCGKTTEFEDTKEYAENWHPKQKIYRCTKCGVEMLISFSIRQYLTKERSSIPQPCPACKSVNVKFHYTEPDYGDGWKCEDCGNVFPGWGKEIPKHFPISFYPAISELYRYSDYKNYERREK